MSTEHQDGKPQLPRVIEQKSIVYDDDIDRQEVREIAALPPIHSEWIKLTGDWKPPNTINGVRDEL